MAGRTPAAGSRLPLGKAVTQAWALWLAGLLALVGGLALLVNPGAGLRLVKWTLGPFLLGWACCGWSTPSPAPAGPAPG